MENVELALGQRTGQMILDSAWKDEEIKLVDDAGVSIDEVVRHWVINGGDVTLNAAIGSVLTMKEKGIVERNLPNQTQAEADATVHADVVSHDMSGTPEHVSDLITPPVAQE